MNYNGWTNRETWVINLWMGDYFENYFDEQNADTLADCIEEELYRLLDEFVPNGMFKDLIDLGSVNWRELAEAWLGVES